VGILGKLSRALGGGDDEVGRDDLVRRSADAVLALRTYGRRGAEVFPAEVELTITVSEAALGPIESFLSEAEFDREVEARLRNALDKERTPLPLRRYRTEIGATTRVLARETAARGGLSLRIRGGDRDGQVLALPTGRPELRLGRGEWHGSDRKLRNDLIVSDTDEFVSRRAARLRVQGTTVEVEAVDQGEFLQVQRVSGERVRPVVSATGRVAARVGDELVFDDGKGRTLTLAIEDGA
jgi:hypothetical protein